MFLELLGSLCGLVSVLWPLVLQAIHHKNMPWVAVATSAWDPEGTTWSLKPNTGARFSPISPQAEAEPLG